MGENGVAIICRFGVFWFLISKMSCSKQRFGENQLVLTKPGGGAFGNSHIWIRDALGRALKMYKNHDLDILLQHFSEMDPCYNSLEV